jgi:hypothetical protein
MSRRFTAVFSADRRVAWIRRSRAALSGRGGSVNDDARRLLRAGDARAHASLWQGLLGVATPAVTATWTEPGNRRPRPPEHVSSALTATRS